MTTSKPARASSRQIARPIRLPPPVTSAAPDRTAGSVNPAELDEVDGGQNGDETEDDVEGQHEMLLVAARDKGPRASVQERPAPFVPGPRFPSCAPVGDLVARGMNPALLSMIAVVLAGGATALQAPTNARLMGAVGSPVNAAFVSFAVGTAALAHRRPC